MNSEHDETLARGEGALGQNNSNKLMSLLALATGAAVMPQSGVADIIYEDLSASPPTVGYDGGVASYLFADLPGSLQFGFQRYQSTYFTTLASLTYRYRWVTGGWQGGTATATLKGTSFYGSATVLPFGATWSAGTGVLFSNVLMGIASTFVHYPASNYDHQYLAWAFSDTSQGGATRYGWIEVGLDVGVYPVGPNVTIYGYAYDDTGAQLTMGQVPEPSSAGLLAMGALALGASGLRKWRAARPNTPRA